jgi:hypothetical protein
LQARRTCGSCYTNQTSGSGWSGYAL